MVAFLAEKEKANGTAVLICPGGGYSGISQIKEGSEIAKWFNDLGVSAFVLYYRMPNGHSEIPLKDAQTALRIIYERAKEWNINKNKIGIMGFSAGGHLASTVGTHFKTKKDRPAFMILAYPVVTMKKDLTNGGSRQNLLGANPSEELVMLYSNELQVTKKTPPTFIVYAIDDKTVPIANSEQLLKALQDHKVPAELHKFDVGGHGFGMRKRGIPVDNWPELLKTWLKNDKLIN
jgi:acetyl esterase/lipase